MTASQVAASSGLELAMTNRYLARLLAAGALVATAPRRRTKRPTARPPDGAGAPRGRSASPCCPSQRGGDLSAFTTDG